MLAIMMGSRVCTIHLSDVWRISYAISSFLKVLVLYHKYPNINPLITIYGNGTVWNTSPGLDSFVRLELSGVDESI